MIIPSPPCHRIVKNDYATCTAAKVSKMVGERLEEWRRGDRGFLFPVVVLSPSIVEIVLP